MLSLSPRFDLFRFCFPVSYFPDELKEKYAHILNQNQGVITTPVDYLNESIKGIILPGLSETLTIQPLPNRNTLTPAHTVGGRINIEPNRERYTYSSKNPLTMMDKTFTVTLRQNQNLYNYFFLYETLFYRVCKPELFETSSEVFTVDLLDEDGRASTKILLYQPHIQALDGLEFSYDKAERQTETFSVAFSFNNINIEFVA